MIKRPLFWLGLLLGGLTLFRSLHGKPRKPVAALADLLLDLTGDAVVACGSDGTITCFNAAAEALFGPQAEHLSPLFYSNGQRVPPGQLPLNRVRGSGQSVSGAEYHCTTAGGAACALDVSAYPLPGGGAAAVLRDVTVLHNQQAALRQAQARQAVLGALGRRLSAAAARDAIGRAVVEETFSLLRALPGVQVRLYGYNSAAQTLTRLASEPEDRPKRPLSVAQAQPPIFSFDAGVPALWQLYIAREPSTAGLSALGEAVAASAYAAPLLAGGLAAGHLFVSSSACGAFDDPVLRQTLEIIASSAALALAGPPSAELAAHLAQQRDAVREIAQAIAGGSSQDSLADMAAKHVKHIVGGICTISIASENGLRVVGTAYQDDLLFPERAKLNHSALHGKTAQKAWRTQKMAMQLGVANPGYEEAVWRAFAGAGCHSVLALPLASWLGVLMVTVEGSLPLPDAHKKFLETIAALLPLGLTPATAEASRAGR